MTRMGPLVHCFIEGIPQPQARHRSSGKTQYVNRSKWRNILKWKAKEFGPKPPIQTACHVVIDWYLPRPAYAKAKYKIFADVKPDLDNFEKETLDGLTDAGWWRDDSLVVWAETKKYYVTERMKPGMDITVWPVRNDIRPVKSRIHWCP